jgi:hypothetical protein
MRSPISRGRALKSIAAIPVAALAASVAASAASPPDNKKQFKYQDKPGPKGAKCAGCRFFKAPHGCTIVHGTISPNGWCIAYAPK